MTNLDYLVEDYPDVEFLKADGFDDAVMGFDTESMRLVYSISKCMRSLMEKDGMNPLDAEEYFAFNVKGAYVGDKTPIWCEDYML